MQPAFLPQTTLAPDQTRTNFTIFDNPVMDLLLSPEAEQVCSKMFLIYGRLKRADWKLWQRPGVLYFGGDDDHTAWESLCELAGVASATLAKALKWMNEHKVIAYFARKNGAGIRIYFNLALNSVKPKQKNLALVPTSAGASPASANEARSWEDRVFPKNVQDSDLDASRDEPPPLAENTSDVVAATAVVSDVAAPVAPTKPTLALVPPVPVQPSAELKLAVVEALVRNVAQVAQEVRDVVRSLPSKDFMLGPVAGKVGRVSADTALKVEGRMKAPAARDVGATQAVADPQVLVEYDEMMRQEAWKDNALRALPPEEYEQRIAALEQTASTNPSYGTLPRWTDEAKRAHFDALLKNQLWEAQR